MLAGYMMPSSSQLDVPTSNLSYLETFECVTFQTNLTASVNITTFGEFFHCMICMCMCVCVCVCMCMCVCVYVCMYVYICVCMHV